MNLGIAFQFHYQPVVFSALHSVDISVTAVFRYSNRITFAKPMFLNVLTYCILIYWSASATWQLDVAVLEPESRPLPQRDGKYPVLPEGDCLRMLPVLCWYPVPFENENIEEHSPVCFKEVIKQII